eukprot:TRINITY_DN14115_c0_g1_i1.p1 TRINITY_DN14115_c0_g1~~TRINITY_DN14115_c0_g1_i1.p1  ORF type:complete len:152 (+),score=32.36 TRINITY_DN14115_c0_g1_i1:29-457(+)
MAELQVDGAGIQSAIKAKFTLNAKSGWVVAGYKSATSFGLQSSGTGGVTELLANLKDDQVQWALVRIPDSKDGLETVRDVMIHWTGPNVKKIEAAKKKTHTESIRKFFEPRHAEVEAISRANFNEQTVRERSAPLSGSHVID